MKNNVVLKEEEKQSGNSDEILKATALLYFQEVLLKEEYEGCKELLDLARKFGVQEGEIKEVIEAYLRGLTGRPNEATRTRSRLVIKGRP